MINPVLDYEGVDLYIRKEASLKMLKHCRDFKDMQLEVMGFMVGHRYEWESREYTIVEDVVTSDLDTTAVSVKFASFEPLFKELDRFEKEGKDYILVGWYHSHPGHTSFMSPTDKDTQKRMFKKDFQSAIVIDPINIEMKAFKLHEGEVYEKPFAVLPGPDSLEGREEADITAESPETMEEEEMAEREMVEAEMVEDWEDAAEETEEIEVEEDYWEEEPGILDHEVPVGPAEASVGGFDEGEYGQQDITRSDENLAVYEGQFSLASPDPGGTTARELDTLSSPEKSEEEPDEAKKEDLDALDYAWFAAPVLLGILGGAFGFFAVENKRKSTGYMMLILGFIFSIVWYGFSYAYY